MNALCGLATAVLVSCTCVVSLTPGFAPAAHRHHHHYNSVYYRRSTRAMTRHGSSSSSRSSEEQQLPQYGRTSQGQGSLWARRRSSASVRLSPTETGVPEVAAAAPRDPTVADDGGSPATNAPGKDAGADGRSANDSSSSSRDLTERRGLLLLSTVPLVWGTYAPSVKYLYQMGDSPPGLLFNFACYVVSVLTFTAVASFNKSQRTTGVCVCRCVCVCPCLVSVWVLLLVSLTPTRSLYVHRGVSDFLNSISAAVNYFYDRWSPIGILYYMLSNRTAGRQFHVQPESKPGFPLISTCAVQLPCIHWEQTSATAVGGIMSVAARETAVET